MKIWIAGSVANCGEEENIRELVKTFKYFDGAFFAVNYHYSWVPQSRMLAHETYNLLERYKGKGNIVWNPWLKRHDHAMNTFLHMIPHNDWFLAIDAQELPKKEFLENMRSFIEDCDKQDIGSIWWNRPYLIRKRYGMEYVGNPHCWPYHLNGKSINIADESKVKYDEGGVHFGDFIYNKKKRENTILLHGIKYSLYDPPNNQFQMFYKDKDLLEHETRRMIFCNLLENEGYTKDLNGLEAFFNNKDNLTKEIIDYLNFEFVFRDFYRYKILKHNLDDILKDRYTYRLDEIQVATK